MSSLKDISDEDLQAELKRRERAKAEVTKPVAVASPDFTKVIKMGKGFINQLSQGERDEDFPSKMYEVAMETIFGREVFLWINKHSP